MELKIERTNYTATEQLFLFAWGVYSISCAVGSIYYDLSWYDTFTNVRRVFAYTVLLILGVLICRQFLAKKMKRARFYSYMIILLFIAIIEAVHLNSGLIALTFFLFLGQEVDFDKIVRFDIKLKIPILLTIVGLCALGVLQNRQGDFQSGYKMAYGFGHPNGFAFIVIVILLEWLYIRYKKMKFYDWLGIMAVVTLLIFVSNARTSIYTFVLMFILFFLANYASSFFRWRIVQFFMVISAPVMAFISFYLVRLYGQANQIAVALDLVLSNRLSFAYEAIRDNGIRLFGNKVEFSSRADPHDKTNYLVDNTYIHTALSWGSVFTLAIIVMYVILFIRLFQKNRIDILLLSLFFVIAGFGENCLMNLCYNLTLLCLLGLTVKEKSIELTPAKTL